MRSDDAQHVVLAALALAIALVCEAYQWARDDEDEENAGVIHVSGDVVVLDTVEEGDVPAR